MEQIVLHAQLESDWLPSHFRHSQPMDHVKKMRENLKRWGCTMDIDVAANVFKMTVYVSYLLVALRDTESQLSQ
jgi:hypothetical protein